MLDRGHGVGRGTTNRNSRGSASDRRARKLWLLVTFGDGVKAPCSYCGGMVDFDTITVDRYPVMGCDGGTYKRDNIRPSCGTCNATHGGKEGLRRRWAKVTGN